MTTANDILEHYGIKGMHWGVRRSDPGGSSAPSHPMSEDAARASAFRDIAKSSGVHALSNKELKDLNERMNLEQNYARLVAENSKGAAHIKRGEAFVKEVLKTGKTINEVMAFLRSPAGVALKAAFH